MLDETTKTLIEAISRITTLETQMQELQKSNTFYEFSKYLPVDQQKEIAKRIYDEKIREEADRIIEARYSIIDDNGKMICNAGQMINYIIEKIAEDYIFTYRNAFESEIMKMAKDMIEGNIKPYDPWDSWRSSVNSSLYQLSRKIIEENADELRKIMYDKIMESCNEMMLNAFCADIIRTLDLDKVIKEILKDKAKGYKEEK